MAAQALQDLAAVGVDDRQEALRPADDEAMAAGQEADAEHLAGRHDREGIAPLERAPVHDADRAVLLARCDEAAVGAEREVGPAGIARAGLERPAEAPAAGEVPDEDGSVDAGGVERPAVAGDPRGGDGP